MKGDRIDLEPIAAKSGPPLAIHLNAAPVTVSDQPTTFLPGDTIKGFISRDEPIIAPHGTIDVAFTGRSAVHYAKTRQAGNGTITTHYYSKVILFEEKQTLVDGPLHIAPDHNILPSAAALTTNNWPFTFQIPTHTSTTSSNLHEKDPTRSFLPIEPKVLEETITTTPLPASFNFHPGYSYDQLDAWVEYFLEASLTEEHASTSFFSGQPKTDLKTIHARHPILVSSFPSPPIHDFRVLRHVIPNQVVSSQRLLPGRGKNAKLSAHEHLSKLFKSSSVPKFGFAVEMEFPTILQLGKELPLGIRVLPDGPGGEVTSELVKGVGQLVTIESIRLRISERVDGKIEEEYSKNKENYVADGKVYCVVEFGAGSKWGKEGSGELVVPCIAGVGQGYEGLPRAVENGQDQKSSGLLGEKQDKKQHRLSWSGRSNKSTSSRKSTSKEKEASYSRVSSDAGSPRASFEEEKVPFGYTYHPTNEGSSSSGDGLFLQLGAKLNLELQQDCITGVGVDPEANKWEVKYPHWKWILAPSFTTFNISVKYLLKWEVTLNIVGEKVKVSAEHGFTLVPGWS